MSRKIDTAHFVEKSRNTHGDRYDYTNTKIDSKLNQYQKVEIFCAEHGYFQQSASEHMQGKGCYQCGRKRIIESRKKGIEAWKSEFSEVHGNKYSYDLWTEDCSVRHKFQVICPIHDIFLADKSNHRAGRGCPSCSKTGFKPDTPAYLYILHSEDNYTKLGISKNKPNKRATKVKKSSGKEFFVYDSFYFEDGLFVYNTEQELLRYLRQHYGQPTDSFEGSTECFIDLSPEYLKHLIEQGIKENNPLNNEQHSSTQLLETA